MGCEMVYILEQRLKAQGIQQDKSAKVLQDIVRTMFDRSFLSEKLFVPQDMYSLHSTRKIFDRLAHSSIMRLSESSMDKLFDLIVMGAKYQLMCAPRLDDMIQVTLRHLGTVQAILTTAAAASPEGKVDADVINLVSYAEEATIRFYGTLSNGELSLLRQTLARFFQDKRVKVSLFLAEGIQQPSSGKLVAPSCISDQVGLVRSFDDTGRLEHEERLHVNSQKADPNEFFCHPVALGDNLYRKDREKAVPPPRSADTDAAKSSAGAQPQQQPAQSTRYVEEQVNKAAVQELDLLAALVQTSKAPADNFKLNLCFDDEADEEAAVQQPQETGIRTKEQKQLEFGADGKNEGYIKAVGGVLEGLGLDEQQHGKSVGEDLLDLMDSVA